MAERHEEIKAAWRRDLSASATTKIWRTSTFSDAASFASFLNVNPAQGAGEAFASTRPDGTIDGYYYF